MNIFSLFSPSEPIAVKNVLVIVSSNKTSNWYNVFAQAGANAAAQFGANVKVEQCEWKDIQVISLATSSSAKPMVELFPSKSPIPGTNQHKKRTFVPDLVIYRSELRGLSSQTDYRNILFAFKIADIPSINSSEAMYNFIDRPWVHAELLQIAKKHLEKFPLIPQIYYPSHKELVKTPQYPLIVKAGHLHGGFGKAKVDSYEQLSDLKSVLALTDLYVTAEPFFQSVFDLRVQRVGSVTTAFQRSARAGQWKRNRGASELKQVPVEDRFLFWADQVQQLFGGLDVFSIDAIAIEDNEVMRYLIIEVNGSATAFPKFTRESDEMEVAKIALGKLFTQVDLFDE